MTSLLNTTLSRLSRCFSRHDGLIRKQRDTMFLERINAGTGSPPVLVERNPVAGPTTRFRTIGYTWYGYKLTRNPRNDML